MPLAAPVQPLLSLLHQMRTTIERLDNVDYAMPAPGRSSGGVGGHVRHCLDHVDALVRATRTGICDYDRRARGTDVETCRAAAVCRVIELCESLEGFDVSLLDETVLVESQVEPGGSMILTRSSVGREIAFVISHTIHHNAIVAQLLTTRGIGLDARFGVAPATPLDAGSATCAQ
jgi:hypothetical protein